MNPQNELETTTTSTVGGTTPAVSVPSSTPEPTVEASTPDTLAPSPDVPRSSKKYALIGIGVAVLLIGGYLVYKVTSDDAVAVVNGIKISQADFLTSVAAIKQNAAAAGINLEEPNIETEIKNQAIEALVNDELLMADAEKLGVTKDEAGIKAEYDTIAASLGGEEALRARMEEVGLTDAKLRDSIIIKKYIETKTDIETLTVTDEEVQAFLESLGTSTANLPPLEQIRPQIEQQILGEKQQAVVNQLISDLRSDAEIEIKLNN